MNVLATTPTRATSTDAAQQTVNNSALDQKAFLKLLSTQLSNQDPTAPQDQSQMLAQLAQFSTVEGINNLQTSQSQTQASDLLGKTVQAKVTVNNLPHALSGTVTAVKYDGSGVTLTLNDAAHSSVTLDQITQVSN
jgi:flagellar basal-body rod modification protein FlgD